jgi:hypothetical protein
MPKGHWNRPRTPGVPPKHTSTPRNWTRAQVDLLEDQYGRIPNERLAARLGRSVWAMRLKAVKLGIRPWKYDQLSKDDVLLVLGQTGSRQMLGWMERGWLAHRRVQGRGAGGFRYIIEEPDLIAFLTEHDEQVDRRRVDPAYQRHGRQWITTGEVYRRGGPDANAIERAAAELGLDVRNRGVRRMVLESDLPSLIEWRRQRVDDIEHLRRRVRRDRLRRRGRDALTAHRIAS